MTGQTTARAAGGSELVYCTIGSGAVKERWSFGFIHGTKWSDLVGLMIHCTVDGEQKSYLYIDTNDDVRSGGDDAGYAYSNWIYLNRSNVKASDELIEGADYDLYTE